MARLLLLTNALQPSAEVLPALGLLLHQVRVAPAEGAGAHRRAAGGRRARRRPARPPARPQPVPADAHDRGRLPRSCSSSPRAASPPSPPTGASTTSCSTPPARPRSRPGCGWRRAASRARRVDGRSRGDPLRRRRASTRRRYTARVRGRVLDLTFKEFELLKFLAQHPGRVFTRAQLLQEVWGYDYFGGTRTVDVHVRRLRAKLGPEHESLIGTVRNVGYRFVAQPATVPADDAGRRRARARAQRSHRLTQVTWTSARSPRPAAAPAPSARPEPARDQPLLSAVEPRIEVVGRLDAGELDA